MKLAPALLLALAGFALGWSLPDIDHNLWFATHRSLLTHSFLLPLAVFGIARGRPLLRYVGIGVCLALAVHLFFDLFPQSWVGYALLTAPMVPRRMNQFWSITFLLSGIAGSLVCAWLLVKNVPNEQYNSTSG